MKVLRLLKLSNKEMVINLVEFIFIPKVKNKDILTNEKYIRIMPKLGQNFINNRTFNDSEIVYAVIDKTVTEIKSFAFEDSFKLRNIYIPNSVKKIGIGVFRYCISLNSIKLPKYLNKISPRICENTGITKLNIINNIESIGRNAFSDCKNLEFVKIGDSVKKIGEEAFCGNPKLKKIVLGNSVEKIDSYAFVMFSKCTRNYKHKLLEEIIIPNKIIDLVKNRVYKYTKIIIV
jgi:hypothetical protein